MRFSTSTSTTSGVACAFSAISKGWPAWPFCTIWPTTTPSTDTSPLWIAMRGPCRRPSTSWLRSSGGLIWSISGAETRTLLTSSVPPSKSVESGSDTADAPLLSINCGTPLTVFS